MIKDIIQFSNGFIMVFNERGEQIPKYQGNRKTAIEKLKKADLSHANYKIGDWNNGIVNCKKEQFFSMGWE